MDIKLLENKTALIFKFPQPKQLSDIDYIEISHNCALNKYKNEMQHLVIIKRWQYQENVCINHIEIIKLLEQYGLHLYISSLHHNCKNTNHIIS